MNIKEYNREYYQRHKEQIDQRNRERHQKHKEQLNQYHREYYQANREQLLQNKREEYKNNKEEIKQKTSAYRQAHPEMVRLADAKHRIKLKTEVLSYYSNGKPKCANCGIDDMDVLTVYHIDGGGGKLRATGKEWSALHRWLKSNKYPNGYQILCANCHLRKTIATRRKIYA